MAEGWLRHLGGARVAVDSAGTDPKDVHPLAIRVMGEVGIDISGNTSDHVDTCVGQNYDLVLTVCDAARESCPVFPGARRLVHRAFEDPDYCWMGEGELTGVFRRVRDEIGNFCRALVAREVVCEDRPA